jgi:hypothetical protein
MCTMVHLSSCLSLDLNFILHFLLSCWMPVLCVLFPNMLVRYCSQVTTTISQSQAISKRTSQVIPEGILVILPLCHGMWMSLEKRSIFSILQFAVLVTHFGFSSTHMGFPLSNEQMLVTCVTILAVDFTVFPRRYAKTETYGTGLVGTSIITHFFCFLSWTKSLFVLLRALQFPLLGVKLRHNNWAEGSPVSF